MDIIILDIEPTNKALSYCKIRWNSDTDNDIMNNKNLKETEKKQRLTQFIECYHTY